MTTETDAPQIRGNYPLGGERIGPAWRQIWVEMSDGQHRVGIDYAVEVAKSRHLAVRTIQTLLEQATREGLLVKSKIKMVRPDGRCILVARYRRIDVPLATATNVAGGR